MIRLSSQALVVALLLSLSPSLSASEPTYPAITSIEPSIGLWGGGSVVTIRGDALLPRGESSGVGVWFGSTPAEILSLTDTELRVRVPAHRPEAVDVTYGRGDGGIATLRAGYAYLTHTNGEMLLLPVLARDLPGGSGSRWSTRLTISNQTESPIALDPAIETVQPQSVLTDPPGLYPVDGEVNPSRLLFAHGSYDRSRFTLHLRGGDAGRSRGEVEIPIIRDRDLHTDRITLLDVAAGAAVRTSLRVYTAALPADGLPGPHEYLVRLFDMESGHFLAERVIVTALERRDPLSGPLAPAIWQSFDLRGTFPEIGQAERLRIEIEPIASLPVPSPQAALSWAMAGTTTPDGALVLVTPQ